MKITSVLIEGPWRFEKDLAPHFMHVEIWRCAPPRNETEAAKLAWCHRAWKDGVRVK